MTLEWLIWLMIALMAGVFLAASYSALVGVPRRRLSKVGSNLQAVNLEYFEALLDPCEEAELKRSLAADDFRRLQRNRIRLAIECLRRMAHNAAVLAQWANAEASSNDEDTAFLTRELAQRAVEVRIYTLAALIKLRFWLFLHVERWPLLPTPALSDIHEACGLDGAHAYSRLKSAAQYLGMSTGRWSASHLAEVL